MTASAPPSSGQLHQAPPASPATWMGARRWRPWVVGGLLLVAVALAVYDGSRILLLVDEPVERFVTSHRYGALDAFFRQVTLLGDGSLVLLLGVVGAVLAWRRCPPVAAAVLLATFCRPTISALAKSLVGRERPRLDPLDAVSSHAFPSGHAFAATVLWGLLPLVVPLFTDRRWVWWGSVIVSATAVLLVAASRVYLGVHWLSDVVGGVAMGLVMLAGVEAFMRALHGRHPCSS